VAVRRLSSSLSTIRTCRREQSRRENTRREIIAWDADSWAIHVPSGKLATFSLAATRENATFQLRTPRVFAGVDVYNPGAAQATLSVRCQEAGEITTTVDPGAIKRLRTGWHSPCSRVTFASSAGAELQFDNLAYLP
jgi:hypothetical protein